MMVRRLLNVAVAKSFKEALKRGHIDIVRNMIKKGLDMSYKDGKGRNFIMSAIKCNNSKSLEIVIILIDAGCDMNHIDRNGWSCLHYACACGALDIIEELLQRGVSVCYNQRGYGPEELQIARNQRANSLLQHTEHVVHAANIKKAWEIFKKMSEKNGYCISSSDELCLGDPIKITFEAPASHSLHDRIRIVDLRGPNAIWMQTDRTIEVPPGNVGTITLDSEVVPLPSTYRFIYERYEAVSCAEMAKDGHKDNETSTTVTTPPCDSQERKGKLSGKMTIVAMTDLIVNADSKRQADTNEYEIVITSPGSIGLTLEPYHEGSKQTNKIIVKYSCGQAANVQPGDLLISIDGNNVEHSGFKHTVWELDEAERPLVLRFRRGTPVLKKGLLHQLRKTTSSSVKKSPTAEV